jgi:hypothetical protein
LHGQPPPITGPLAIGAPVSIEGSRYYAVARVVYESDTPGEAAVWEEWALVSPEGALRYLALDDGTWTLYEPAHPMKAPGAEWFNSIDEGDSTSIDGIPASVVSCGPCHIFAVEGALPWTVQPGEPVAYCDLESPDGVWSAEINANGAVDWFKGSRYTDQQVRELLARDT